MEDNRDDLEESLRSGESQGASSLEELNAFQAIISALQRLPSESRQRIFLSAATFLGLSATPSQGAPVFGSPGETSAGSTHPGFSNDRTMSPKEFLLEKQPQSDVERVACLAYYLTHYLDTPHFKTLDLSKLNTEAAQPKFSNATYSSNNAVKQGYLVAASKGQRQLSAAGERFVQALPDRAEAKAAMIAIRPKRRSKTNRRRFSKKSNG